MPGQFVLRKVLGCDGMLNTYQPTEMAEVMVNILRPGENLGALMMDHPDYAYPRRI